MNDVTRILEAIGHGRTGAAEELLPLVYDELCRLAAHKLAHEPPGQTLQATALVHEAYIRLVGARQQQWSNHAHFYGAAAEAMRRILIDRARRKRSERHGGGLRRVDLDSLELGAELEDDQLLALNEALTRLEESDKAKAQLVKLRFFAGLSLPQAAEALGMPEGTAKRTWAFTRAWLYRELTRE
jgi:RNA polymerase sigma factor (TIGR02999 family)